jgi:hypothetical protein
MVQSHHLADLVQELELGVGHDGLGAEERARKNTLTHLMLVHKVPHAPNAIGTSSHLDVFNPNSQ